jgi:hypothetical protein
MLAPAMHYPVLKPAPVSEFLATWSSWYTDSNEDLYTSNIGLRLNSRRVLDLFLWKNGGKLSASKLHSVRYNFIARLSELESLPADTTPTQFLERFSRGGAIWRIYWLHCWRPDRYPIYDQHVHRAMVWIRENRCEEIPPQEKARVANYTERFLPFWRELPQLPERGTDKALWTFGRFLRRFPCAAA